MPKCCKECKLCAFVEIDFDDTVYYKCQPLHLFLGDTEINEYCKVRHPNCPLREVEVK